MRDTELPTLAAMETIRGFGIEPDRCDVLQNGSTLVLRLTETLVARVVQDRDGPRQGTEWFARENAIARHLTQHGAPVIPLHESLPPGPHERSGYPMNFWRFVVAVDAEPEPREIGRTLWQCHNVLRSFPDPLPQLAIMTESLAFLRERALFPATTQQLLRDHLERSLDVLGELPHQALHGDAHFGNLMNTTRGLLWTDWEDAFAGPVEWDVASIIWNAKILDDDRGTVKAILDAYREAGGEIHDAALQQSLVARAAVMTAWYPILYPNPDAERQAKLKRRIEWLEAVPR